MVKVIASQSKTRDHPQAYTAPKSRAPTSRRVVVARGRRGGFNDERRAQVASIRKVGACMPCHLRKVAVGMAKYWWSLVES